MRLCYFIFCLFVELLCYDGWVYMVRWKIKFWVNFLIFFVIMIYVVWFVRGVVFGMWCVIGWIDEFFVNFVGCVLNMMCLCCRWLGVRNLNLMMGRENVVFFKNCLYFWNWYFFILVVCDYFFFGNCIFFFSWMGSVGNWYVVVFCFCFVWLCFVVWVWLCVDGLVFWDLNMWYCDVVYWWFGLFGVDVL